MLTFTLSGDDLAALLAAVADVEQGEVTDDTVEVLSRVAALLDAQEERTMPRFIATFTPQAWVNDYAMTVDPEGPTEWETVFDGLTDEQREEILYGGHDAFDLLKSDPDAPVWVRDWSGPFEIHIREEA